MRKLLIILGAAVILYSCGHKDSASKSQANDIAQHFLILLDLSDRLIVNPNQTDIDTSAIRSVFDKFEAVVRKHLVVKSKDKFSIRIIPQKGSKLPINDIENSLTIDLSRSNAAEKLEALNKFKAKLGANIKLLYQYAHQGNKSSDYYGVDIWQYFNEQINTDIKDGYGNHILILTDGYFDFEDKRHGLSAENQSTVTSQLLAQLDNPNWKKIAKDKNIGIIPVKLKSNARFLVAGIQPKTDNLLESEKLKYIWTKWLTDSGVANVNAPISNASSGKMRELVRENL